MPNDAKLGLVVGVSLVIVIAVVFFRKDAATGVGSVAPPPTNGVQPATPPMQPANNRIVVASPTVHEPAKSAPAPAETRLLERQMTPGLPRLEVDPAAEPSASSKGEPDDPN